MVIVSNVNIHHQVTNKERKISGTVLAPAIKNKYFITITFITFKRAQFIFTVRASDRGTSALHADVEVELVVVDRNNKPPIWDQQNYGPIYVKENAAVGSIVTSVKARFVLGLRQLRRPKLIVLIETR